MLLATWGWQEFFGQFAARTIPYSQFKAHLERRELVEAAVKELLDGCCAEAKEILNARRD